MWLPPSVVARARPTRALTRTCRPLATHTQDAPDRGVVNLCVAQDKLSADLIAARLSSQPTALDAASMGYCDMRGTTALRSAFAGFLERSILPPGVRVDPEHLCASAGAGAVIENLAFALSGPGDSWLVPAPWYAAFRNDISVRAGVRAVPVHEPDGALFPTVAALEAARAACAAAASDVKVLLLCHPGNPTGQVLPAAAWRAAACWALRCGMHVVSDEVYASSVWGDGGEGREPLVSAVAHAADGRLAAEAGVPASTAANSVHAVFALSKDFAASGLRCGFLWSPNRAVHASMANYGYFCAQSTHSQAALAALLGDAAWVAGFQAERLRRLRGAHAALVGGLAAAGLAGTAAPATAGLFVWLDLTPHLPPGCGWEAERELWDELRAAPGGSGGGDAPPPGVGGVLLTPGRDCAAPRPGFFRACFAAEQPPALALVGARVAAVLRRRAARAAAAAAS